MNKKLFLGMFAAAGMLLATSCSNDELDVVQSGNEAQVSFSLGLEGGIATRAISDGKSADKLVYAVFDENGNRITGMKQVTKENVEFPTTEMLTLAKGQTYKVAFWAQDADCEAYTIDDNMNVTVSYDNATNNDETRDAFFKTETFTVSGSTSMNVVLKRPFAQINVGVEQVDWNAAVASGVEIQNSSVTIKQAATKINLVTGAVSDPTDVTYSLATIPAQFAEPEDLKVDVNGNEEIETNEIYKWLSMSYILVDDETETEGVQGAAKATLEGLKFTFQPKNGNEIILEDGLTSVPVQRNWRTNILGKLLTGDITFNISIDEMYEGDNNVFPVGDVQALMKAIEQGGTVTLTDDVVLSEPLVITDGKTVTINLNGHDIINKTQNSELETYALVAKGNSILNIEGDGNIQALADDTDDDGYRMAVYAYGNAVVNIKGGNFYNSQKTNAQLDLIYANDNAIINISGGTFKSNCYSNRGGKTVYWVLNKKNDSNAQINVTGGTFINFNPASPQTDDDDTYVVEGYTSVKVAGTDNSYAVVPGSATIDENTVAAVDATSFAAAVNEENANIVLCGEESFTMPASVAKGVSIKGSGDTELVVESSNKTISVDDVTISDVVLKADISTNNQPIINVTGTGVVFDNVKVSTTLYEKGVQVENNASVTIKNSTFEGANYGTFANGTGEIVVENCDFSADCLYAFNGAGKFTATNCTFRGWMSGWKYGGTFDNCTFESGNRYVPGVICYGDTEFKNCTFGKYNRPWTDDNGNEITYEDKYAVDVHVSTGDAKTVTFTNCKYSDGTDVDTYLFVRKIGDGKKDPVKVIINGTEYTADNFVEML